MSVEDRILAVLSNVTDKEYDKSLSWNTSLSDLDMDSLEILDFLYELERSFNVTKLADGHLLNVKNLTLNAVRVQLLAHLVVPASAN
jgi:acyl carrier protein